MQGKKAVSKVRPLSLYLLIMLVFAFTVSAAFALPGRYVASRISGPFHIASKCQLAKKIVRENRVWYSTRESAIKDGHTPCKICKP